MLDTLEVGLQTVLSRHVGVGFEPGSTESSSALNHWTVSSTCCGLLTVFLPFSASSLPVSVSFLFLLESSGSPPVDSDSLRGPTTLS